MKIVFKRSQFLQELFPFVDINNDSALKTALENFYSLGSTTAEVSVNHDFVNIHIPNIDPEHESKEFYRATNLCAIGKFGEARPILEKLIEQNPTVSEYHRNLAQTYEEIGDHEKAIDILIDALKWDPKNHWALVLMGNIYARHYDDVDTAIKYYDQVIEADPKNYIALNNIGGAFLQAGRNKLAERFLKKAYNAKSDYPNTTLGLAILNLNNSNLQQAFEFSIETLKSSTDTSNQVYQTALSLALDCSRQISKSDTGKEELVEFIKELEQLTGTEIRIEQEENMPTVAKVEIAENHGRDFHKILFKPGSEGVDHLILHELFHLKFIAEARKEEVNKRFVLMQNTFKDFRASIQPTINRLLKEGYPSENISNVAQQLFEGIHRQVYNAPIDIFIEDGIYKDFPALRPHQFLSLFNMNQEALKAVTDKQILKLSPPSVLSQSKTYNIIGARIYEELYGVRLEEKFNASPSELELVNTFWDEFLEYRNDREPGEEYELVQHWGEDLGLDKYFRLEEEVHYAKDELTSVSPESVLDKIERDPLMLEEIDEGQEKEFKEFLSKHTSTDINMAVTMYMVGALEYFKGMDSEKVRDIAFEIAMLGRSGISPEKNGYRLNKIPNVSFSGYKLLAYYYTSWAIALPDMVSQLQLPFEKEYQTALSIKGSK
ncbi:tetratricopeptide repeat protein [Litoribacter alkaliphilus]|uniref:Tetratricopeptide repeat protein n=1 Tax=Litoribacter ruber TaxID=702568 RepID=A0AAP2CNT6_9BACT|nr:tetratricopeptide repeat protein [Litoribacter alkaliphilus]MBS9525975.1 tetratricopeptide repeat protein [Litoribacter alkaliphilus]